MQKFIYSPSGHHVSHVKWEHNFQPMRLGRSRNIQIAVKRLVSTRIIPDHRFVAPFPAPVVDSQWRHARTNVPTNSRTVIQKQCLERTEDVDSILLCPLGPVWATVERQRRRSTDSSGIQKDRRSLAHTPPVIRKFNGSILVCLLGCRKFRGGRWNEILRTIRKKNKKLYETTENQQ